MNEISINGKLHLPNLLLISGNGRNVGKTTLACKIISHFAKTTDVIGLKVSPHFHSHDPMDVVFQNEKLVILEEKQINGKDSSLMLQAGANKVYFVMVKSEDIEDEFENLTKILPNKLIICESGGLIDHAKPGLFFMVNLKGKAIVKNQYLKFSPEIVLNDGKSFNIDLKHLEFTGKQIRLKINNDKF